MIQSVIVKLIDFMMIKLPPAEVAIIVVSTAKDIQMNSVLLVIQLMIFGLLILLLTCVLVFINILIIFYIHVLAVITPVLNVKVIYQTNVHFVMQINIDISLIVLVFVLITISMITPVINAKVVNIVVKHVLTLLHVIHVIVIGIVN